MSEPISPVIVMGVFLLGLAQFKIIMEVIRNKKKSNRCKQMEHQYKNENLHGIAYVLRGTFSLFDAAFHCT